MLNSLILAGMFILVYLVTPSRLGILLLFPHNWPPLPHFSPFIFTRNFVWRLGNLLLFPHNWPPLPHFSPIVPYFPGILSGVLLACCCWAQVSILDIYITCNISIFKIIIYYNYIASNAAVVLYNSSIYYWKLFSIHQLLKLLYIIIISLLILVYITGNCFQFTNFL